MMHPAAYCFVDWSVSLLFFFRLNFLSFFIFLSHYSILFLP